MITGDRRSQSNQADIADSFNTGQIDDTWSTKPPPLTASYTCVALTEPRRLVDVGVDYGPALKGISAADVARALPGE